ncbi:MAG: carbohydrate binding family 9 domain-containing protein [Chlorobi bacterium]|nr:carbohydrate binding family 9 domain-containing protein [Chlorobiota bacterium]
MRIKVIILVFFFFDFFQNKALSQGSTTEPSDSTASFITNIKPTITISKCSNSSIIIDGKLDDEGWKNVPLAKNFVEIYPGDNTKPPVETEVLLAYDEENLYMAYICYDPDISKLRANLSDRDNIWNDDYVGVVFDTYSDDKQAYEVFVNPYSIQGDLIRNPLTGEDDSYDMIFSSECKIYKDKWIAEMSIPFKSLRFPDKNNQKWKFHFIRTWPRRDRTQMSWAVLPRDEPSFMGQAGIVRGFKGLKGSKSLEILPYVIGGITGYKSDPNNPNSKFIADSVLKGDFGVGLKYGFTSNLTGELVYNPDFSQVESDAAQVDINSPSALFYPEKRPFFLEGSSIFNSYINVVYTRMINDPLFAAKLTGKIGDFDIGYIGAYDRKTQFILPFDYGSRIIFTDSVKSLINVLRIRKSLKGESYIGFIATDREVKDGYNRVISFDGSLNFWRNYYFNFQVLRYDTKEINDTNLFKSSTHFGKNREKTLSFDGEKFSGFGGLAQFRRSADIWSFGLESGFAPPEARRDVGFIEKNNHMYLFLWNELTVYLKKGFFLRLYPYMEGGLRYDYSGRIREQWLFPSIYFQGKAQTNCQISFWAVNNEEYQNVYHKNVHRGLINININTFNAARGGIFFEIGKYIVRFVNPSYIGFGFNTEAWLTLKPIDRLSIENTYNYSELSKEAGGEKLYSGYILRNKTSFQFTRHFFLRLVTQYDSFTRTLNIDPLFSYKWNPFTIFYIGSTHNINDYGSGKDHSRFIETTRQIFTKFQYLFRL